MDFTALVESGKYKKSDLSVKSQSFISGMERALECSDEYLLNYCGFDEEESASLAKIKRELAESVMNGFMEYLHRDINAYIVGFADSEASE